LRGKIKKEYGFEREVLREFPVYPAVSVRVVGRQDAGIQGIFRSKYGDVGFRSGVELMRLMYEFFEKMC